MSSKDLFEGIDEFLELDESTSSVRNNASILNANKQHGGFENMTEDEIKEFENSYDFREYKAHIEEVADARANLRGKTVQEILGLSNLKETPGYSFNALEHYDVDLDIYQDIVDQSPLMQQTLEEGEELMATFKYLHQDLFLSLYKYKAKIIPEDQMHISTRMNRGILASLINTPEYIALRQSCRMDQFNAAYGTEKLGAEAIKILKEAVEKLKDFQKKKQALDELVEKEQQIDELVDANQQIDEMLQQMQRQGASAAEMADLLQERSANEQSIAATKALANKIAQECDELVEAQGNTVSTVSRVMGKTLDATSCEIQQVSNLCEAWGIGGNGGDCQVTFQTKKEALERIRRSPQLDKLTALIGRFKESAITEQKKKAKDGAVEIKSVTSGDKIQDTLPSERMNLVMNATKADFYRRMTEHQLMVYSKEAHKQKNKGPIIVCVDTSGSMRGDEETWSKALTVGVLEIAQMQKRDFACILYSDHADKPIIIRKDEVAPNKIIDCAEKFHGGGTNFESALNEAIKLIEDSRFKNADILFITDGDCGVSDKFLKGYRKIKEEKDFKTLGVLVNLGRGHCSDSTLKEFCDSITLVSSIAQLNDSQSDVNKAIFGTL